MDEKQEKHKKIKPQKTEKKDAERTPAPAERAKKEKILRTVACIVGALAIAAFTFALGMCVSWFSIEPEIRTLIDIKNKIDRNYYEKISDEKFYGVLFGAINDNLLDEYSAYMTPEEFAAMNEELEGNRAGLGLILITKTEEGEKQMLVSRVCGNSPAEEAGIKAGNYIVGYGKTEEDITLSADYDKFTAFMQDFEEGEKFYLRVLDNSTEKTVEISREQYVENYVFYRTNESAYTFATSKPWGAVKTEDSLACLDDDTAYIRIVQFTGNAAQAFSRAMEIYKEEGKTNLILDLRGNGGGYLDTMQSIAAYFCKTATERKPVVAIASYGDGGKENFRTNENVYDEYFTEDSRICVLADGDSASASECLLGCMLDYGAITYEDICLTETDGVAKTFGKGIMQSTYLVNSVERDAIKLTTAKILWPISKNCIHGRGILAEDGTKTVARDYIGDNELIAAIGKLFG